MKTLTRRDFLRTCASGAAGLAALSLVGCGAKEVNNSQGDSQLATTVVIGTGTDPESFAPWLGAQEGREICFYNSVYEPLARLTVEGVREYVLAKSVEKTGTGCYRIELYDYIKDSKGNPITADDVIFSFDQAIAGGSLSWALKYLDHFEKQSDTVLDMYTKDESAVGLDMLLKTAFIVNQNEYLSDPNGFATNPVGTGPYTMENYVPGSSVTLKARDDYWQTDASLVTTAATLGSIETVEYKVITEGSQLSLALESGEIMAAKNLNAADIGNFVDDNGDPREGYNVYSYLNPLIRRLEFNCGDQGRLSNKDLRGAICYAIDTEALAATVFGRNGTACSTISTPYYNDYDPSLNEGVCCKYDPEKAKELMEAAGVKPGEVTVQYVSNNNDESSKVAVMVKAYLEDVGINCNLNLLESAALSAFKNDPSNWDISFATIQSLNSPGMMNQLDINAQSDGFNALKIADMTLQGLFEKANSAETYSVDTVTELLNYVTDNYLMYPLYYVTGFMVTSDKITNIVVDRNMALIPGASTILK